MAKPNYTKENIGKLYDFTLIAQLNLPDTPELFFQIADSEQNKFLIPSALYQNYGLKIGQAVICRLDRVNCNGEIFFEPLHPYYSEKKTYLFKFIEKQSFMNALELEEEVLVVEDVYHSKQWIRHAKGIDNYNPEILAYVQQIKRGRLHLVPYARSIQGLNEGNRYRFRIERTGQNERMGKVYVVSDPWGNLHAFPAEFYQKYGLKIGSEFEGYVDRLSTKGFYYIEPQHPVYVPGEIYSFKILDKIKDRDKTLLFIEDCFKEIVKIEVPTTFKKSNTLVAKVIAIHMGKPELMVINDQTD